MHSPSVLIDVFPIPPSASTLLVRYLTTSDMLTTRTISPLSSKMAIRCVTPCDGEYFPKNPSRIASNSVPYRAPRLVHELRVVAEDLNERLRRDPLLDRL